MYLGTGGVSLIGLLETFTVEGWRSVPIDVKQIHAQDLWRCVRVCADPSPSAMSCDEGRKAEHSGERDTVRVRDLFLGFVSATLAFQFPNFDWNWGYGCETSNWTCVARVTVDMYPSEIWLGFG